MKSLENMKISTISELKLVRKHLRSQLHITEVQIQNEYSVISSNFLSSVTYFLVEKGISVGFNFLMNKIIRRRE